jgi:signal transduction histidine kinase
MSPLSPNRSWETLLGELRAEFEIREAELNLLHEIDLRILRDDCELPETLEFIAFKTAQILDAGSAQIYLRRGKMLEAAVATAGPWPSNFPYDNSVFAPCFIESLPLIIDDLPSGENHSAVPFEMGPDGTPRSLVAVPVTLSGTVLGVLCAIESKHGRFQQTHAEICEAIAAQISIALENAELFDQARLFERVDHLVFSRDATEDVLQQALEAVFEELLRLDYATVTAAQLLFLTGDPDTLEIVHSTNQWDVGLPVSVQDSVSGRALSEGRTLVINDVASDPDYKRMLGTDIKSEIVVPILVGADHMPIGVFNVESPVRDAFGGVYQLLLERFARKVSMLLAITKLRSDIANTLEAHHSAELMIAVGDQASNMVHKLNNVVGAMRVRVKEVQQNCAAEVEASDFLRESLDHLLRGADETLELPKRVQTFLADDTELSNFDVNVVIASALERVMVPSDVDVRCLLAPDVPTVPAFSLDVAAENLIRNAIDAMPDGGILTISSEFVVVEGLPGGRVELTFSDTGTGMSESTRRRLFEIDFTTKPRKDGKGMGVGLWWVRQWVRRSHGEISVDAREGEGTTFVVKLPLTFDDGHVSTSSLSIQKGG